MTEDTQNKSQDLKKKRPGHSSIATDRRSVLSILGGLGSLQMLSKDAAAVANNPPTANFTHSPPSPSPDEAVTLYGTASSDPDGEIEEWEWVIEDSNGDRDRTNSQSRPTYRWDTAGYYFVSLTVTDNDGLTDSVSKRIRVDNSSPRADFIQSTKSPTSGEEVTLDGTASSDLDGEIEDWEWKIEESNGEILTINNQSQPTYVWESKGSYEITLTVTDNGGATDTETKTIDVENVGPTADFSYSPSSPNPGEKVTFDDSRSEDPDGRIEDWEWEIEEADGDIYSTSLFSAYQSRPAYTWETEGSYEITLTVTDNGGATDTETKTINVENVGPTADLSWSPSSPKFGAEVSLNGGESSDSDGQIDDWQWEIEESDGGTYIDDSGSQTTYTWETGGSYEVSLTVTDNGGATDTITETIEISNRAPEASFSYSPTEFKSGTTIALDASESVDPDGTVSAYIWHVSDTQGSSKTFRGRTAEHQFDTPGTYTVTLRILDEGGKEASVKKEVEVENRSPTAEITTMTENPTQNESVILTASASRDPDGEIVSQEWTIQTAAGERSFAGQQAELTFEESGEYEAQLTVKDDFGDTDMTATTVTVAEEEEQTQPTSNESTADDLSGNNQDTEADESGEKDRDDGSDGNGGEGGNGSLYMALGGVGAVTTTLAVGYRVISSRSEDGEENAPNDEGSQNGSASTVEPSQSEANSKEEPTSTESAGTPPTELEKKLYQSGYESVDDIRRADEAQLADTVGTELAARIKAEVGSHDDTEGVTGIESDEDG